VPGSILDGDRRRAVLVATAAALAATPALAADAAKPPKTSAISLSATPTEVVYGAPATFTGRLNGTKAGVVVDLQRDPYPYGDGFSTLRSTTTDQNGSYSFTLPPTTNAHYQAVGRTTTPRTSATVLVGVHPHVGVRVSTTTPTTGTRVRFSGSVRPAHDGRVVRIQRRTDAGTWVTVARTTLRDAGTARSRYTRRVRINADGVFRVRLRAHGDHLAGVSREVAIDAR
jgi:opacity protein-like surface antigen